MIQVHPINNPGRNRYIAPSRIVETGSFRRTNPDKFRAVIQAYEAAQREDGLTEDEKSAQTDVVNYVIVDGLDMLEIVETPDQMNMLLFAWENRGRLSAGAPAVSVFFNLEEEAPEFTVITSC